MNLNIYEELDGIQTDDQQHLSSDSMTNEEQSQINEI